MASKKEQTDDEQKKEQAAQETAPDTAEREEAPCIPEPAPEPTAEEQLTARLAEAEDRHLRLMAEFDNFRRRTLKEKESIYPDAVAETVKALLPVLDNFQRALEAPCGDEEYRKGVDMTYNGFMETLAKMGLAQFAVVGDAFDPNLHNAVMHTEDESLGKNVISQVFQRGYRIGDTILRYATVQTAN